MVQTMSDNNAEQEKNIKKKKHIKNQHTRKSVYKMILKGKK